MTASLLLLLTLSGPPADAPALAPALPASEAELAQCWAHRYFGTPGSPSSSPSLLPAPPDRVKSCVSLVPAVRLNEPVPNLPVRHLAPYVPLRHLAPEPRQWRHMPLREYRTTPDPSVIDLASLN
jgi:hypothetical protein